MSVNRLELLGNVGNQPEIRTFDNGNKVANFNLATSDKYTTKDGQKVDETEWTSIAVFGKKAEIVDRFVNKGDKIYIDGKKKTRSYEKDGSTHYVTECVLNDFEGKIELLGKKDENKDMDTY